MSTETPETPADVLRRAAALMRSFEDEPWVLAVADWLDVTVRDVGTSALAYHAALKFARAYLAGA